jgi:hypothetical protein
VPPIAPTLGAGGKGNGKQGQNMDGELLGQVHFVLEGRQVLQDDNYNESTNAPIFIWLHLSKAFGPS